LTINPQLSITLPLVYFDLLGSREDPFTPPVEAAEICLNGSIPTRYPEYSIYKGLQNKLLTRSTLTKKKELKRTGKQVLFVYLPNQKNGILKADQ
jgi:hypothetical protein